MTRRKFLGLFPVGIGGLITVGCAEFPASGTGVTTKRLTFTMTVAGSINSNYVYIVALRPSALLNPTDSGPIPVIAPPWGNGFVAGNCGYFVRWDPVLSPPFGIFTFADSTLINYTQTGVPISYNTVNPGDRQITFTIDLSQIAASVDDANNYQSIQVNFLTMDRVPQGTTGGSKDYDALGDTRTVSGINSYITIPLRVAGTYDNSRYGGLEPTGDVVSDNDPDLDISDFSIVVPN